VAAHLVIDRFLRSDGRRWRSASVSRAAPRRSRGTQAQCRSPICVAAGGGMGPRIAAQTLFHRPPTNWSRVIPLRRVWDLDLVAGYLLPLGAPVRLGPRCVRRAPDTAWYCGIGALGTAIHQRRYLGRTRFSRLLAAPVDSVYRPHIGGTGIAHGYQGLRNCLAIAIYGALFTLLALWRKSLRPGMIAHAWTDIAGDLPV
jgi:hypothetical protein